VAGIGAISATANFNTHFIVGMISQYTQHSVALSGLCQQFDSAFQPDIENTVGARNGFEFAIVSM